MEKVIMAIVGLNFLKRSYFFPVCDDWKSQIPSFCDMFFWNLKKKVPEENVEFNWTSQEIRATKHHSSHQVLPRTLAASLVPCYVAMPQRVLHLLRCIRRKVELRPSVKLWEADWDLLQTWWSWKKTWKNTFEGVFGDALFLQWWEAVFFQAESMEIKSFMGEWKVELWVHFEGVCCRCWEFVLVKVLKRPPAKQPLINHQT